MAMNIITNLSSELLNLHSNKLTPHNIIVKVACPEKNSLNERMNLENVSLFLVNFKRLILVRFRELAL